MNIRDIARLAGVSPSTVSRALNHPDKLHPDTLQHIQEVMEKNHYQANPFARNIIRRRTRNVTLIVPSLQISYMLNLSECIRDEIRRHGFILNLVATARDIQYQNSVLQLLSSKGDQLYSDGLIIAGATSISPESVQTLLNLVKVPVVIIEYGKPENQIPTVYVDEYAEIRLALSHLKQKGYTDFGVFAERHNYTFTKRRLAWLETTAKDYGLHYRSDLVVEGNGLNLEETRSAADKLLRGKRPSAIYAFNDILALATLSAAERNHISVPEDLGIICSECSRLTMLSTPTITGTIRPLEEMAHIAVDMLLKKMDRPDMENKNVILPPSLRLGSSC